MQKVLLVSAVFLISVSQCLMAEPLVLDQAGNVQKPGILEIGLEDISYGYNQTDITDNAGNTVVTLTNTYLVTSVFARYAFTPAIETSLILPYSSVSKQTQLTGGNSTITSDSGLADPVISGKYSCKWSSWEIAGKLALSLPEGSTSSKIPSVFRQGLNIEPVLALTKDLGLSTLNVNIAYNLIGKYTDENSVKQQLGDVLTLGIGAEKKYLGINWCAELIYNSLSAASSSDVAASYKLV